MSIGRYHCFGRISLSSVKVVKGHSSILGIGNRTESFPGISAGKESACNAGDPGLIPGSRSSPGEGGTPVFLGFPGGSKGKESTCNVGDLGSIPESGRSLGRGHGNSLQYSCLENPMDRGAWRATVHGVSKSQTRLSEMDTV